MKKFLSIILALTFCFAAFSALAPTVAAKSETISESEAKELIVKAYEFCRNVRGGFAHIHENSSEYKIEVKYGEDYRDWENYWLVIEENLPGGSYEKMCEYAKELSPFGCRIPLTLMQDWGFVNPKDTLNLSPWSSCVLERLGIPFYFSNSGEGAVFVDDFSVDGFSDEEIREYMKGTLVLTAIAADKLNKRGFTDDIGVEVREWSGKTISSEIVDSISITAQYGVKELCVVREGVEELSSVIHMNKAISKREPLFPGVTRYKNTLGGHTVVFSGTPDMPFTYYTAFSMLNETRKAQLVKILKDAGELPVYYPEDAEVYIRAGKLPSGEVMVAFFNLGFDDLEDTALVCETPVTKVEKLNPDGTRSECAFEVVDGVTRVAESADTLTPVILFIS